MRPYHHSEYIKCFQNAMRMSNSSPRLSINRRLGANLVADSPRDES